MANPFQYVTLANVVSILGERLYDNQNQMWSQTELILAIQEGLQFWNALTATWRGTMLMTPTANQQWYDITTLPGTLRPNFTLNTPWIQSIEYRLMEPENLSFPLVWGGSNQFNFTTILQALSQRYSETIQLTGCRVEEFLVDSPISSRVQLTDAYGDIVRVAWIPVQPNAGYTNKPLTQTDVWAKRSFNVGWTTASEQVPTAWMQSAEPPLAFDVDRVPPCPGQYDVIALNGGTQMGTAAATTSLVMPQDWQWLVVWGALQDLLGNESNAKDDIRAKYCQRRYDEGLKLLSLAPAVLEARINNVPIYTDSWKNGDNFNPLWQVGTGTPRVIYTGGLNLMALSPTPATNTQAVSLTVVQNAPLPTLLTDVVPVSREDLDSIVDYAQHILMFKIGGQEFQATIPLFQNFMNRAAVVSAKLSGMGEFQKQLYEVSQLQWERTPRTEPASALGDMNA